jgi:BirA family transcriptional regulator, biotin operon repressor / biotin---[acetyl-CoA-carboxylase] ligase
MAPAEYSSAWPIVGFAEIDSTNEEARRRAAAGDTGPCWLVAERQSAGRGRLGRQWDSPPGNLFATALFAYPRPLAEATLASFAAGLAVIDAARAAGVDTGALKLKWPNDVLAGDAKLAGILIETGTVQGRLWMAAGFGVNVASAPKISDRATACLTGLSGGEGLAAEQVLAALDIAFRAQLVRLLSEGFGPIRENWLARAAFLGERVSIPQGAGRIEGVMRGLADDGALIAEQDDGSLAHVRAGEISVLN